MAHRQKIIIQLTNQPIIHPGYNKNTTGILPSNHLFNEPIQPNNHSVSQSYIHPTNYPSNLAIINPRPSLQLTFRNKAIYYDCKILKYMIASEMQKY